jgi:YD repeat-containing protein
MLVLSQLPDGPPPLFHRRVRNNGAKVAEVEKYHPSGGVKTYQDGAEDDHHLTYHGTRYWPASVTGAYTASYSYDGVGNVTGIADTRLGFSQTFGYDAVDRLVTVGGLGPGSFTYDARGNRLTKTASGGTVTYGYDPATNRLATVSDRPGVTFTYDGRGNLTADGVGTYSYTVEDLLASATVGGVTTTYRYDGTSSGW